MCGIPFSPAVLEGAVLMARAAERTTGEPGAVPKTGSLITFMSSLKSFAFLTQRWTGAERVRWTDGRVAVACRVRVAPGPWRRARQASRRSTGSPRPAGGLGIPRRERPQGAHRHRPPPPAAARRCCCGCGRSADPRRAGRRAGTQPRTTRRKTTRRRRPPRARRADRRRRGWRSSAGRPARSSRRGAQARRWARARGLQQDPVHQCPT